MVITFHESLFARSEMAEILTEMNVVSASDDLLLSMIPDDKTSGLDIVCKNNMATNLLPRPCAIDCSATRHGHSDGGGTVHRDTPRRYTVNDGYCFFRSPA